MNSKGIISIQLITIIIIGIALYATSTYIRKIYILPVIPDEFNSNIPTLSTKVPTPTNTPTPTLILTSTPTPTPTLTPTSSLIPILIPSATSYPDKVITAIGKYTYASQSITYNFNFPSYGGDVTGTIEGICKGNVHGRFLGGDGGNIKGSIIGECEVFPLTQNFQVNYNGTVYLNDGRINLTYTGNIPFVGESGNLSLYFNP